MRNDKIVDELRPIAFEIVHGHGYVAEEVKYLGEGAQSICFGVGELALLISQEQPVEDVRPVNSYSLQQWMSIQAIGAEVKTAEIVAVGEEPYRYALMRRAPGVTADTIKGTTKAQTAAWFRKMGAEVHKINDIQTIGFGEIVLTGDGRYRGRYATWGDYLDACMRKYLFHEPLCQDARKVFDLFLNQKIVTEHELEKIATQLNSAKSWGTKSTLIHYDNRLANLVVDGREVVLVDWGLAYAGIGLPQELIKVTEAPEVSAEPVPIHAFLEGYGLAEKDWPEAIERGMLMLVLDGLAMSYAWAEEERVPHLGGIRNWLTSIKRISKSW